MADVLADLATQLRDAARVLAHEGLVTAFGHVSVRLDDRHLLITPPVPLDRVDPRACAVQPLDATELAPGVPKEAWLHIAVLAARPDVGSVCRAQPETGTAMAAAGVGVPALTGHAVLAGAPVSVGPDATLVRTADAGNRAAASLGAGSALLLPGNGAITTGDRIGTAVARMWLLERAARVAAAAAAAGTPRPLSGAAARSWQAASAELLGRVWDYLCDKGADHDRS